ncbi:phospholipid/cholesterol/gamma-HCH transport system substrate-binding protein [Nocardioides thalensis]|uniref:Phospholipid/cholesterol/gamma-HCH transport system substrate-binding protein n=2 Tax=Nocardioides thalensis TaxID=1914755 RepID=A0A853BZ13_9ACTN|nr:MCE family protein [Nocardioides thalensis]NYI99721.1 phospholipid/cholesterol/gamma-HCH transport system substrate-binding protein [Nocardioides thalensis]
MMPFRERNPVVVGAVSIAVLVLLIVAALRASDLPLIGGGDTYYATFEEAGGLKVDDEVRLAGVRVGKVESIELVDGYVKVGFRIKSDASFGEETAATIKVKTILGDMFLALDPAGDGELPEGETIPVERTTAPYDVVDAFTDLAETSEEIDTDQLANALTTLADLTRNTPEEFRSALDGISALSTTIAERDDEINSLLKNLERVSTVLDARDEDIVKLMEDADILFRALLQRRDAIHDILVATSTLSTELTALVRQSRDDLKPALQHLERVVAVLNKNEDNIDESLRVLGPFYRVFANVFGNGPWWDTYIANLPPIPGIDGGPLP